MRTSRLLLSTARAAAVLGLVAVAPAADAARLSWPDTAGKPNHHPNRWCRHPDPGLDQEIPGRLRGGLHLVDRGSGFIAPFDRATPTLLADRGPELRVPNGHETYEVLTAVRAQSNAAGNAWAGKFQSPMVIRHHQVVNRCKTAFRFRLPADSARADFELSSTGVRPRLCGRDGNQLETAEGRRRQ